jgi:hypothetical protein
VIVKSLTRSSPSFSGILSYILDPKKSENGIPQVIKHNLRSDDLEGYVQEFMKNESFRRHSRKSQVYIHHEIIGLSSNEDKDSITKEMMEDLTRKYIELRGYDGIYLASIHSLGTDSIHAHIVSGGVKFRTGLAHRMSHKEFQDLKISLQEYHKERYPELTRSFCEHGKQKEYVTNKEWQAANREKGSIHKSKIQKNVQTIYENSKTKQEFLENLRTNGYHHYERNGEPKGIAYNDQKFRFSRLEVEYNKLPNSEIHLLEEKRALGIIKGLQEGNQSDNKPNTNNMSTLETDLKETELSLRQKLLDQDLESILDRTDALFMEMRNSENGKLNEHQKEELDSIIMEEVRLSNRRTEMELNSLTDLEQDEETKLMDEIRELRHGNSDRYQIFKDDLEEHKIETEDLENEEHDLDEFHLSITEDRDMLEDSELSLEDTEEIDLDENDLREIDNEISDDEPER